MRKINAKHQHQNVQTILFFLSPKGNKNSVKLLSRHLVLCIRWTLKNLRDQPIRNQFEAHRRTTERKKEKKKKKTKRKSVAPTTSLVANNTQISWKKAHGSILNQTIETEKGRKTKEVPHLDSYFDWKAIVAVSQFSDPNQAEPLTIRIDTCL